jgi:predicted GNAT family N-acyltransferase
MTAEDPVEYNFFGINQVHIREDIGLTFASALRAFLRQDPDIILVGEIRDFETAEIAIKAALTGHLVLSTLHTNDAPSTIARLINMGIEPIMVSSSVILIVAQRLARKICENCKEEEHLSETTLIKAGLSPDVVKDIKCYMGKGCPECNNTGYKGRIAVHEIMPIKDELKETELKNYGLTILRFDDAEVMNDMANVLRTIEQYILEYEKEELDDYPLQHTPNPSQEGKATHEALISSKQTYPLRLAVLWQHKNSLNECGLEIDDLESTFHVGAYKNEELVSIGTFLLQNNEKFKELKQYRLRAMATSPKVRGENFGKKIIEFAINELQNRKVELLWCDAREVALGFYEKMGFITVGDFYNVPQIGPHKLMYKKI